MQEKDRKQVLLRLPKGMWEDLSRWADDDIRSINAQIEYLLRRELEQYKRLKNSQDGEE